jgi:hypothetical protein
LLAPARTPKPIIEQITKASRALLINPDYHKMLIDIGFNATPESNPEHFPSGSRRRRCALGTGGQIA